MLSLSMGIDAEICHGPQRPSNFDRRMWLYIYIFIYYMAIYNKYIMDMSHGVFGNGVFAMFTHVHKSSSNTPKWSMLFEPLETQRRPISLLLQPISLQKRVQTLSLSDGVFMGGSSSNMLGVDSVSG